MITCYKYNPELVPTVLQFKAVNSGMTFAQRCSPEGVMLKTDQGTAVDLSSGKISDMDPEELVYVYLYTTFTIIHNPKTFLTVEAPPSPEVLRKRQELRETTKKSIEILDTFIDNIEDYIIEKGEIINTYKTSWEECKKFLYGYNKELKYSDYDVMKFTFDKFIIDPTLFKIRDTDTIEKYRTAWNNVIGYMSWGANREIIKWYWGYPNWLY